MISTGTFAVLLPAAGSGSRFGGGDKLLQDLGGMSVLDRSVRLFSSRNDVGHITVVTGADRLDAYRDQLRNLQLGDRLSIVRGGAQRWESVLLGLRHLAASFTGQWVAIHDAARPLCPVAVIDEAFRITADRGAALPALAEPATLKRRAPDGTIAQTIDRTGLFQAQTPQCFDLRKLLAAYESLVLAQRASDLTDDAQVYERAGLPVPLTAGSPLNLKITTSDDLALARAILAAQKS